MKKRIMRRLFLHIAFMSLLLLSSGCEDFFNPDPEIVILEEDFFKEWSDFRSAEMGLYAIQQELIEQIVVLGELRADLLEVTPNADKDLLEVYNFNISKENKYASPDGFYMLIANCNNLKQKIINREPNVLDRDAVITNYDRLYGEVECMRAWAYFNAVRIYGKVPYIYPFLNTVEEIEQYVNQGTTIIDSFDIEYDIHGYDNDTILNQVIELDRIFLNLEAVIDTFTNVLENELKAVGVRHNIDNNDATWEATVWTEYSYHSLLGQLYLYDGNYARAIDHFNNILYNYENSGSSNIRFGLDRKFRNNNWKNIFTTIDPDEHIYSVWFDKSYNQQNQLQELFSMQGTNRYMLKPTSVAIKKWETMFDGVRVSLNDVNPNLTVVTNPGSPGDFFRGHGISYLYYRSGIPMTRNELALILQLKQQERMTEALEKMEGIDTVMFKYTINKDVFDRDASFPVYRAAGIHLYAAEIHALWEYIIDNALRPSLATSLLITNNGNYDANDDKLGVRGRVGFANGYEAIRVANTIYTHDPYTNLITGFRNYSSLSSKQLYLVDQIMEERARELAYEGERFYDLMRVAKRRGDNGYLADRVAEKFSGEKKEQVRAFLMDEQNWYVNYFN